MKLILTISLLIIAYSYVSIPFVTFNHYYVSNSGSDANSGTSSASPWQTISKVNGFTFSSGDTISFKCGDTWNERLVPPISNLYFNSYSTGSKPIITGFASVTGFTQVGNVYSKVLSGVPKDLNTVYIDGKLRAKARYPNSTYITFVAQPTTTQMIVPHDATHNVVGMGLAVRDANWIIDRTSISTVNTGVTNDTLGFSRATTYSGGGLQGNAFFYQNNSALLDSAYEWGFDSTTNTLSIYDASGTPTVQVSNTDTSCYMKDLNYVTFDGINFTGSNKSAIEILNTTHITVKNCTFDSHGQNGIAETFAGYGSCQYTYALNDSFTNCLSGGYYTDPSINDSIINCYLHNIGIYPGMGKNGNGTYIGIYQVGLSSSTNAKPWFVGNVIDSCGYEGINFKGKNSYVYHNLVTNFGFVKQDGGGIYTFDGNQNSPSANSVIRANIVRNGIGAPNATNTVRFSEGIYLDATSDIFIDSNIVTECTYAALTPHGIRNSITNNLISNSIGVGYIQAGYFVGATYGITSKHNVFYSPNSNNFLFQLTGNKDTTESIDSNYYFSPTAFNYFYSGSALSFSGWQSYYPQYDVHSSATLPSNITSNNATLVYDSLLYGITIPLVGNWTDKDGNIYRGSITLQSFTGKLLWPSSIVYNTSPYIFNKAYKLIQR